MQKSLIVEEFKEFLEAEGMLFRNNNDFTVDALKELDDFLSKDFFERSGGGIGVTRMIRAMKLSNLL